MEFPFRCINPQKIDETCGGYSHEATQGLLKGYLAVLKGYLGLLN